jgi:hypothetical protein
MTDEMERILKEVAMAKLKYYPGICLEGTEENPPKNFDKLVSQPRIK